MPPEDYLQRLRAYLFEAETFVKATFSGRQAGRELAWRRVIVRPVELKGQRVTQVSYFDEKRDITKNYAGDEALAKLEELLALPFSQIHVQTTHTEIQVRISKKGKVFVHEQAAASAAPPSLDHDHAKPLLLPADRPDPFLQAIGMMTPEGKIRAQWQRKFRQINEFLRLVAETEEAIKEEGRPLHIVDCGCGSAHLTFAVYHLFNHVFARPARVVGIDLKADLLAKQSQLAQTLGWPDLTFAATRIRDFQPETPPDIVLALHACDTATDEALAQAVRWQSRMIFSAPCCHHHLQAQMDAQPAPPAFKPVLRHGILKDRLGDVLTDAFRAQLLRLQGYRTDVIEFISAEHTDKNLLIRAVKTSAPGNPQAQAEYADLKAYWGVTPYLETLLSGE
ncbi:MAG TPA: SAM-dependent methyltransferase [Anaerolineae bacterium]|nr:SAM-dependent methyltransferase [Anaerolineae bacterium]